ncbi:epimerase [Ktedonobacteria bacterium brp13]|nr:epimerase [Ktedonobacteria bacterium brp13]
MRVLVIGGTRFIGLATVRQLAVSGHDVTVYHRGQTEPVGLPTSVSHIHTASKDQALPVTYTPEVVEQFRQLAPDIVIHMLLLGEQDALMTSQVFKGITDRIIVISSQDVYRAFGRINHSESGELDPLPLTEESTLRSHLYPYREWASEDAQSPTHWMHSYDKILVEQVFMRDPTLRATVLRLPMVYGPHDQQHRIYPYLKRMDDARPVILLDAAEADWYWTHGYVENVAAAIVLAAVDERSVGHIYNVGERETVHLEEWVQRIADAVGWPGRIVRIPQGRLKEPLALGIDPAQNIIVATTRLRQDLGYSEIVAEEEALRRTVFWERANPPEQSEPGVFDYAEEDRILKLVY